MELAEYPSIVGTDVEITTDLNETKYPGKYSLIRGIIRKAIYDVNGERYFVIESLVPNENPRFFLVTERHAGDSIPREFSRRPDREVIVGVAIVKTESLVEKDVFGIEEVDYFSTGGIRSVCSSARR
ncbi:MAG: hypothetical protein A3K60_04515 [Euryarchaeota archaeon RBG_19FT_COMBO_56_21]|nr:MAG: hypothetical protein A3K60_04515 [Euryarchaeota archaeon RBG_19FT_COMBO_56_21]